MKMNLVNHAPLALFGRNWSISFISWPEKQVVIKGKVDREELLDALAAAHMPVMMLFVIEAMIGGVTFEEKT
jgi:hypothetical protein